MCVVGKCSCGPEQNDTGSGNRTEYDNMGVNKKNQDTKNNNMQTSDLRKCTGPKAATFNVRSVFNTSERAGSTNSCIFQEPEPGYRSEHILNTR